MITHCAHDAGYKKNSPTPELNVLLVKQIDTIFLNSLSVKVLKLYRNPNL